MGYNYTTEYSDGTRYLNYDWYLFMCESSDMQILYNEISIIELFLQKNISTKVMGDDNSSIHLSIDGGYDVKRALEYINEERSQNSLREI